MKTRLLQIFAVVLGAICFFPILIELDGIVDDLGSCQLASDYYKDIPQMSIPECLEVHSNPDLDIPIIDGNFLFNYFFDIGVVVVVAVAASLIFLIIWRRKKSY